MADSVTIDQLPPKVHQDGARRIEEFEPAFIEPALFVSGKSTIAVTRVEPSKLVQLLGDVSARLQWSLIQPFDGSRSCCFGMELVPGLVPEEALELLEKFKNERARERDRKRLKGLLEKMHFLGAISREIYLKRQALQKG